MNNKIKAAVDIGSNSIKMRAGRVNKNGKIEVLRDVTEVVRLGRCFVNNNYIPENIMQNAERVICGMVSQARALGADDGDIKLVGTMALRSAENSGMFIEHVRESTGLEINVISGEEEARLSWKGAVADFNSSRSDLIMFDTGGGSTEFVFGDKDNIRHIQSVPVGAVSLSEKFFMSGSEIIKNEIFKSAEEYVMSLLNDNLPQCGSGNENEPYVVGIGGGVVAMASVKNACETFIPTVLHGSSLTRRDLIGQIKLYSSLNLEERQNILGLPPSRADVILGSACIVLCALKFLGAPFCRVSINGLRHGVLTEMLYKN